MDEMVKHVALEQFVMGLPKGTFDWLLVPLVPPTNLHESGYPASREPFVLQSGHREETAAEQICERLLFFSFPLLCSPFCKFWEMFGQGFRE